MSQSIPIAQAPTAGAPLSLLSLSIAASNAIPAPVPNHTKSASMSGISTSLGTTTNLSSTSIGSTVKTHRRLSSAGRTRRRMSDARDAAVRPLITASVQSPPLANSLSTSPPPSLHATSLSPPHGTVEVKPIIIDGKTKRRGNEYKCESCAKVYRHPSCLIKHRWEHTPHWREASKFVLSKHQQVQLLEAAAILSHMSPDTQNGTSLPEDRSMWPSFLSGGSLPLASSYTFPDHASMISPPSSPSVPMAIKTRSTSAGPRLHDYTLAGSNGSITHFRPGLIGVRSTPSPVTSNPGLSSSHSHEDEEDDEEAESPSDMDDEDGDVVWKTHDRMSVTFDDESDRHKGSMNAEWDGMVMDMDMD